MTERDDRWSMLALWRIEGEERSERDGIMKREEEEEEEKEEEEEGETWILIVGFATSMIACGKVS